MPPSGSVRPVHTGAPPGTASPGGVRAGRRRRLIAAAAVAAACATTAAAPALAAPSGGGSAGSGGAARAAATRQATSATTVTLITGDRLRVTTRADGRQDALLLPDPTRPRTGIVQLRRGKDLYAVPTAAMPYLRAGKLDPALFNVTRLVSAGLDDQHSATMPLIITSPSSPLSEANPADPANPGAPVPGKAAGKTAGAGTPKVSATGAPPAPPNSTPTARAPRLGMTGVKVDKGKAAGFWQAIDTTDGVTAAGGTRAAAGSDAEPQFGAGVGKVWLDRKVHAVLDRSGPQIGVPAARARGLDGSGVTVAVVDTGIDNENADVASKVVAEQNFTPEDSTDDLAGHGTHVASIVAGSGAASGGKYAGVAPGVRLIDSRVLDSSGSGSESSVLAGMEWAVQQHAQVVNMSLGGGPSDGKDPLSLAVDTLTRDYGVLFVIAAGNASDEGTVSTPSTADSALTVGAVDREDVVADFSSRGPRLGDGAIKPEITAPGVDIVAAQANDTELGPVVAPGYISLSGTSMATPHVAGAAALLKQQHPNLTPAQLKAGLVATAKPSAATPVWHQGVGRVDVAAATGAGGLSVDSGTLNFGFFAWPHHGEEPPQTRTLTYTNAGTGPVTLSLAAAMSNDQGTPAPSGALTLSASTLTLAAGASGTVTATLRPATTGIGRWSGLVTATAGGTTLRTALGMISETEHYNVKVNVRDRAGAAAAETMVTLFNPDTGESHINWELPDPSTLAFRVEPGSRWFVGGLVLDRAGGKANFSLLVNPSVSVTKDTTVTLDARTARAAELSVPDTGVATSTKELAFALEVPGSGTALGVMSMGDVGLYATPTKPVPTGTFTLSASNSLRVPELTAAVVKPSPLTLHPSEMWPDTRLDGTRVAPVVAAQGLVKGRIALLRVDESGPIDDAVARLARGGAVAVLVYFGNEDATFSIDARPPVPTAYLEPAEGEALAGLLTRGQVLVKLVGQYYTPRTYGLAHEWTGRIPANPSIRYTAASLARINETYRTMGGPTSAYEAEFPQLWMGSFAQMTPVRPGGGRTLFVAAEVPWSYVLDYGEVTDPEGWSLPLAEWAQPPTTYRAGTTTGATWMAQVARPAQPVVGQLTGRAGDDLSAYLSPWTDGNGRVSEMVGESSGTWTLQSGGKVVASGDGPWVGATLPAGRASYALEYTDSLNDPGWRLSTRTRTRWTFPSAHTDPDAWTPLPLLSIDANLPLDGANRAPAGKPMTFGVSGRMPQGVAAVTVRSLGVEISSDGGKTWTAATSVKRVDQDSFKVTVANPAAAGPVALRITAKADDGVSIQQEVTAAYLVK